MAQTSALVEKRIRSGLRHFTLTEASVATGLPVDDVRDSMDDIIGRYECRLQVTENGDLIYNFGEKLRRRGEKSLADVMKQVRDGLWKGFTILYKSWIAITLFFYFAVFLILLIAILIASSSQDRRGRGRRSSVDLGGVMYMFFSIFRWRTITGSYEYRTDQYGYRYRRYKPHPGVIDKNKKNIITAIYDFVFGPPRVKIDPLNDEKEVAAFLTENKGVTVPAELCALAGLKFSQAEKSLTDYLVRFDGEVKVSENGAIYGEFDNITRVIGEAKSWEIVYYWDEFEPEYELTGNSASHNAVAILMNSFNLLFSFLVLKGALLNFFIINRQSDFSGIISTLGNLFAEHQGFFTLALGWIPLVFSILFFLIPAARYLLIQKARHRRYLNNLRKRLFQAIFENYQKPKTTEEILSLVNWNPTMKSLSHDELEPMLSDVALDLDGEMSVSEEAKTQYAFPRLKTELDDAKELRAHRRLDDSLGKIIIDSD